MLIALILLRCAGFLLKKVFGLIDKTPQIKNYEAIAGISKEGDDIISETEDGSVTRDTGIIMNAQKVEHYKIATCRGLTQPVKNLNLDKVADILYKIPEEEKKLMKSL